MGLTSALQGVRSKHDPSHTAGDTGWRKSACLSACPARTGSLWPRGQDPGQFRFSQDMSLGSNLATGVAAGFPHVTAFLEAFLGWAFTPRGCFSEQEPGLVPPDAGHVPGEQ